MQPLFKGKIERGVLTLENPARYRQHLRSLEGKEVSLVVRPARKEPSDPQRKYYFGVVVALCGEHLGYSKDEMHEAFKVALLMDRTGPLPKVGRFSTLDSAERTRFIDDARRIAAEVGCQTPNPGEVEL